MVVFTKCFVVVLNSPSTHAHSLKELDFENIYSSNLASAVFLSLEGIKLFVWNCCD